MAPYLHHRIEVKLRELPQLFNSMDPSPFDDRDLDEKAESFIVTTARELPAGRHGLEIVVHLQVPPHPERATALEATVRRFFNGRSRVKRDELRRLLRRGRTSLIIGILFLAACLFLSEAIAQTAESTAAGILSESLIIGGWVAMWRPLEIFLYDWWPVREELRLLFRLSKARVRLLLPKT